MAVIIQFGCGFLSAMAISIPLIWRLGFGQVRHPLSIIGSISILLASAYNLMILHLVSFETLRKNLILCLKFLQSF